MTSSHLHIVPILTFVVSLLAGCGPGDVDPANARFVVLDWIAEDGRYGLVERELETLRDVDTLHGTVAVMRGGGTLVGASEEPQTEAEYEEALRIEDSDDASFDYTVDGDVVVPFDLDSMVMLTAYHHIEAANTFFVASGLERESVGALPVYYRPTVETGFLPVPVPVFTDNAAYAFTADAFIIPPQLLLNDLPLAANRGVMVHEYSHAVFNRIVHQDRRAPKYLLEDWSNLAVNELRSLDEGVADIFGALQTNDPNFFEESIDVDLFGIDRDLEEPRYYQDHLLRNAETDPLDYDPYPLGSVVASTVWSLRTLGISNDVLANSVIDAMRDISGPDATFRLSDFFNALLPRIPAEERHAACVRFHERLYVIADDLACEVAP